MTWSIFVLKALALQCLVQAGSASQVLLRGGTIIGWNDEQKSLEITRKGSLLINDDRIKAVYAEGEEPTGLDSPQDTEVIDTTGKIITPGFVDTHRHNWQTLWRTVSHNQTLWDYFHHKLNPEGTGCFRAEDIYNTQLMSIYEGLNVGVTTQVDHAHHSWSKEHGEAGLRASLDSGVRVYHAYNLGSVGHPITMDTQVKHFKEFSKKYRDQLAKGPGSLALSSDSFAFLPPKALEPMLNLIR